jgi:hypothetical protein
MEENTDKNQSKLQKIRDLISSLKLSDEKVTLFFLFSSVIGITICAFLLIRAYVFQKNGLIFTHQKIFENERLFQGYEGQIFINVGYFFQGIAQNSYILEKFSGIISKGNKILTFLGVVTLCLGLWFYCSSITSEFESTGYAAAFIFGIQTALNICSATSQIEKNNFRERLMLFGCIIGIIFLLRYSLFSDGV